MPKVQLSTREKTFLSSRSQISLFITFMCPPRNIALMERTARERIAWAPNGIVKDAAQV
jgi:hypothetical protein